MEINNWKDVKKPEYKLYAIRVNKTEDSDIFKALECIENVNGYIKALIRKDIQPHD